MGVTQYPAIVALLALTAACNSGGSSTEEVRQAAIERAREELGLPADAALESSVWVGRSMKGT